MENINKQEGSRGPHKTLYTIKALLAANQDKIKGLWIAARGPSSVDHNRFTKVAAALLLRSPGILSIRWSYSLFAPAAANIYNRIVPTCWWTITSWATEQSKPVGGGEREREREVAGRRKGRLQCCCCCFAYEAHRVLLCMSVCIYVYKACLSMLTGWQLFCCLETFVGQLGPFKSNDRKILEALPPRIWLRHHKHGHHATTPLLLNTFA